MSIQATAEVMNSLRTGTTQMRYLPEATTCHTATKVASTGQRTLKKEQEEDTSTAPLSKKTTDHLQNTPATEQVTLESTIGSVKIPKKIPAVNGLTASVSDRASSQSHEVTSNKRKRDMPEDSDVSAKRARVSSTDSMHANRGGRVADFTFTMMNPRHTPYMDYIRSGKKLAEGRINSGGYSHLVEGKTIYFHNRHEGIICLITFVHRYKSFEALLEAEGIDNMLPQLKHISSSSSKMDEALRIYHSFPGAERVKTFGALAIGVQFLRDHRPGR